MLLKDKNAVIYGGGGAVGGAVARVFAREGAKVFLAGRTLSTLGTAETAQVDSPGQHFRAYRHVLNYYGLSALITL